MLVRWPVGELKAVESEPRPNRNRWQCGSFGRGPNTLGVIGQEVFVKLMRVQDLPEPTRFMFWCTAPYLLATIVLLPLLIDPPEHYCGSVRRSVLSQ